MEDGGEIETWQVSQIYSSACAHELLDMCIRARRFPTSYTLHQHHNLVHSHLKVQYKLQASVSNPTATFTMRYTQTILSLLPSLVFPLVAADCWSDKGPQADQARGLHLLYPATVLMSGQFRSGQTKFACIDDWDHSVHYYLTVKTSGGDEQVTADFIHRGLHREMAGCRRGGHSWDGHFEFK